MPLGLWLEPVGRRWDSFEAGAWSSCEADGDSFHCGRLELEEVVEKLAKCPIVSLMYESGTQRSGDPGGDKIEREAFIGGFSIFGVGECVTSRVMGPHYN